VRTRLVALFMCSLRKKVWKLWQKSAQITRSAAAIIKALPLLGGTIVVIGNAPTALLALLDALDESRCKPPALIIRHAS